MNWKLILKKIIFGEKSCLNKRLLVVLIFMLSYISLALEHTVSSGESLTQIAKMYEVSLTDLIATNNIQDPNKLKIGQKIIIPQNRLVIDLDKLYGASRASNYLAEGNKGKINDSYTLSSYQYSPMGYKGEETIHQVKVGDTLNNLAERYSLRDEQIVSRNSLPPKEMLRPGQLLFIPLPESSILFPEFRDFELLARIIAAEARGESFEGQIAVGAVILNRTKDPRFPNTIHEVVFQKGQFDVVTTGVYLNIIVPELSRRAAQEALRGRDPTNGALFFYNPQLVKDQGYWENKPVAAVIGNHTFTY